MATYYNNRPPVIFTTQIDAALQAAADAAASEAAATSAAGEAQASATLAKASEAAAVVAATAASSISGIYADTSAGLAATSDQDYFYTVSSDPYVLILYLDDAGTAVEQGRIPAATAVQALQRALTPEASDTDGDLLYVADAAGRVVARIDVAAGLYLTGFDGTAQNRLVAIDRPADTNSYPFYLLDSYNHVLAYVDTAGGLHLAGLEDTVQTLSTRGDRAFSENSALGTQIALPSGFAPLGTPLRGQERFVYAGSPPSLRPNSTRITAYPFVWSGDIVPPSDVRRVRANLASPTTWTYEALTVNLPAGYSGNRAYRDITWCYDRANATHYYAINGIGPAAGGWLATDIPIFQSTDGGLTHDFVAYVDVFPHGTSGKIWSPEFFVDDDGTVYMLVCSNTLASGSAFQYHVARCTDVETFASWEYVGALTGSAFPLGVLGVVDVIDGQLFRRNGVYHCVYKAQTTGTYATGRIGVACSGSILGPYNVGTPFTDTLAEAILGEGPSMVELPSSETYRFLLYFDNYLGTYYNGAWDWQMRCYSNDLITWTVPVSSGLLNYPRHFSAVIGD